MRVLALSSLLLAIPALAFVVRSDAPTETPFHPHFQKKIECNLPGNVKVTVSHITVTFDSEGAEAMKPGASWHLGNAHLEISDALTIGGEVFEEGKYSLKARKTENKGWELVLDKPGRFKASVSDEGQALKSEYVAKGPMFEHLSIDIHPAGDKKAYSLYLDVRMDTKLVRAEIVLPKKTKR